MGKSSNIKLITSFIRILGIKSHPKIVILLKRKRKNEMEVLKRMMLFPIYSSRLKSIQRRERCRQFLVNPILNSSWESSKDSQMRNQRERQKLRSGTLLIYEVGIIKRSTLLLLHISHEKWWLVAMNSNLLINLKTTQWLSLH